MVYMRDMGEVAQSRILGQELPDYGVTEGGVISFV